MLEHAGAGGPRSTDGHLRALMKELTLVSGYRDLGALDADALAELVADSAPLSPSVA